MNIGKPPTIEVYGGSPPPLALFVMAGIAVVSAVYVGFHRADRISTLVAVLVIAICIVVIVIRPGAKRTVQLRILPQGLELVARRIGLLRWHEIVDIARYADPTDSRDAVVIFVNEAAARRLPKDRQYDLPAFAEVSLGSDYVVIAARDLEISLDDLLAEINARRSGGVGPLTQQAMR